jgi:hypothetical protein
MHAANIHGYQLNLLHFKPQRIIKITHYNVHIFYILYTNMSNLRSNNVYVVTIKYRVKLGLKKKKTKKNRTNYVIRLLFGFIAFLRTTTFTVEVFSEERAYKYAFSLRSPLYMCIEIGPKRSLNYTYALPPSYRQIYICI